MKAKILLIFLILLSFTVIGCVDEDKETPNETDMLNETTEEVVNETVTEDAGMNDSVEEVDAEEDEDDRLEIVESSDPKTYTIYMEKFLTQPSNITINTGDTVIWFNRNDPTRLFTLVSNEDLWENTTIGYRLSFKYTFNETGTYTYKVLGWEERMKGTIIVK
ncbi:cupredoxin domain-containing protein [uncultured Methanolobus sp.]|uniref:cupredoxin domain-containing protein n=1 Tax=uncultured Methanolobus sp. TaxID=218300 RepID=UPI0029C676E2|nr:cupredoxin domain-containing protein [uncultured Methanolobus sp.]